MADKSIDQLEEYPGAGPLPNTALFIAHDTTTGKDYRVSADRLPVVASTAAKLTYDALFALLEQGTGITITTNNGKVLISSSLTTAPAPDQPDAPTLGVVDDIGDTFSFKPTADYPAFSQYKVAGLPGVTGAVVLDATNSYVQNGRVYVKVVGPVPTGGLSVFVAGSGAIPDGKPLLNNAPFTGTATPTGTVIGTGAIGSDAIIITSATAS
jgi:hypothetical protein